MTTSEPQVIGEGSYGCVHKPSLKCKGKRVVYKNKISKLMMNDDASKEMDEYNTIYDIDKKHKYYLGNPKICDFNNELKSNLLAMRKCHEAVFHNPENLQKFSLLVMPDGGMDIEKFSEYMQNKPITESNIREVEVFFIEFHRIFMGLKLFHENGIIHHDLKPQNIVYDMEKNRANFIDFGLMTSENILINKSRRSANYASVHHWSFPYETNFYNRNKYMDMCLKDKLERDIYYQELLISLLDNNNKKNENDSMKETREKMKEASDALKNFFAYVVPESLTESEYNEAIEIYLHELYTTLIHEYREEDYNKFLQKSMQTIDVFGVGLACMFFLTHVKKFLSVPLEKELNDLFFQMVRPDFTKRIEVDSLVDQYEIILEKNGVLKKYNKTFRKHNLVNVKPAPPVIAKTIQEMKNKDLIALTTEERRKMSMQPVPEPDRKECPDGQIRDRRTNKCIPVRKPKQKTEKKPRQPRAPKNPK